MTFSVFLTLKFFGGLIATVEIAFDFNYVFFIESERNDFGELEIKTNVLK